MDNDENLDLLDLDEGSDVDTLPEATPFSAPHPKRPWLLIGLGLAIIVIAVLIIKAKITDDSSVSKDIILDVPAVVTVEHPQPVDNLNIPQKPMDMAAKPAMPAVLPPMEGKPMEKPVEQPKVADYTVAPAESDVAPVRVIEDRKEVTFNPERKVEKPVKAEPKKAAPAKKPVAASKGSYYVQFGSYATRDSAVKGEQKLRKSHPSLFSGKEFVILQGVVKGETKHRLRIPFQTLEEAKGFQRNAMSDKVDCYVTK